MATENIQTAMAPRPETTLLPITNGGPIDHHPRCWRCKKLLGVALTRPWEIECTRCHARNCYPAIGPMP